MASRPCVRCWAPENDGPGHGPGNEPGAVCVEASAKVRAGGPIDDEEDYALPIWAGVLPLRYAKGEAQPDERNLPGVEIPPEVKKFMIGEKL